MDFLIYTSIFLGGTFLAILPVGYLIKKMCDEGILK